MRQAKVLVQYESGLHARPAAQFVKLAKQFKSSVNLTRDGKTVSAKSMMLVLTLAVNKGTEIEITTDGEDEKEALAALTQFFANATAES
jgi:phosphocarrier protein HPr